MFLPSRHAPSLIQFAGNAHNSFVTGGGDVYPSPEEGLTIFHHRSVTAGLRKRRDFQAFQEGCPATGSRGYIYTKTVSRCEAPAFPVISRSSPGGGRWFLARQSP